MDHGVSIVPLYALRSQAVALAGLALLAGCMNRQPAPPTATANEQASPGMSDWRSASAVLLVSHGKRFVPLACYRGSDQTWHEGDACAAMVADGAEVFGEDGDRRAVRGRTRRTDPLTDRERTLLAVEPGPAGAGELVTFSSASERGAIGLSQEFIENRGNLNGRNPLAVPPAISDRAGKIAGIGDSARLVVFERARADLDGDGTGEVMLSVQMPAPNEDSKQRGALVLWTEGAGARSSRWRGEPGSRVGLVGALDLDGDGDQELWLLHQLQEYDEHLLVDFESGQRTEILGRATVP